MNRFLIRWLINAVALYAAVALVPGIHPQSANWLSFVWMALIFGVVNALFSPLLKLLTCPLILLTLGLFTLVVNALTLLLSAWVANNLFSVGFYIDGFWPAFWGALIVSIVSVVLNVFVKDDDKKDKPHKH